MAGTAVFERQRGIRSDALVDDLIGSGSYRDNGCKYHPSCLTCPFERCKFDVESDGKTKAEHDREVSQLARRRHVQELRAAGHDVRTICQSTGLGRRQVYRYLEG